MLIVLFECFRIFSETQLKSIQKHGTAGIIRHFMGYVNLSLSGNLLNLQLNKGNRFSVFIIIIIFVLTSVFHACMVCVKTFYEDIKVHHKIVWRARKNWEKPKHFYCCSSYLGPCQTSMIKLFVTNLCYPLIRTRTRTCAYQRVTNVSRKKLHHRC